MSNRNDEGSDVPPEFVGAESIDEVYTQVYLLNTAIRQGNDDDERTAESEYRQSGLSPFGEDDVIKRFESIIGQIRQNLESIAGENVKNYTISLTGSAPPSITLNITYTPDQQQE